METKRLLDCLEADFGRLREVAGTTAPATTVPSCPEWTVADLTQHVGAVYHHKVACMRLGARPDPWPPEGMEDEEPLSLLDRGYPELMAEFRAREPDSPAYTWYEPEQTVGFWIRRMAQETVIHRVDAELAAGVPLAAIPDDLAADGIDEFLMIFAHYSSRVSPEDFEDVLASATGQAVRVETPSAAWLVRTVHGGPIEVTGAGTDAGVAVVRGEPAELLLWLWNRGGEGVIVAGDVDAVAYLRKVFAAAAA